MENLEELQEKLQAEIGAAAGLKQLDELRVSVLGKKGCITEKMKSLAALPTEEKNCGRQNAQPAEISGGKSVG